MATSKLQGMPTISVSAFLITIYVFLNSSIQEDLSVFYSIIAMTGFFSVIFLLNLTTFSFNSYKLIPVWVILSVISLLIFPVPYNFFGCLWLAPLLSFITKLPPKSWVPGTVIALSCYATGHSLPQYSLYLLSSIAVLITLGVIFIRTNTSKEKNEVFTILWSKQTLNTSLLLAENLFLLCCIFLVLSLPFYGNVYHMGGYVIGVMLILMIKPTLVRYGQTKPVPVLLFVLFLFSFLYLVILGLFARTFLWYAFLFGILLVGLAGIIFIILALLKQKGRSQENHLKVDFLKRQVLIAPLILFCLSQIPAVDYWAERLIEVDLPAPLMPLALGQYMIKNLTIPAAVSVLLTGLLYLNRRGIL